MLVFETQKQMPCTIDLPTLMTNLQKLVAVPKVVHLPIQGHFAGPKKLGHLQKYWSLMASLEAVEQLLVGDRGMQPVAYIVRVAGSLDSA